MDRLSNAFSILELDAEDDKLQPPSSSSSSSSSSSGQCNGKTDGDVPVEKKEKPETDLEEYKMPVVWIDSEMTEKKEKQPETDLEEYKMPLVWIDLEMTGQCNGKTNGDVPVEKKEKQPETVLPEYKMPLVWIDLEMTGLNIEVDRILEIACIITDGNLTKSVEGPDLVIHQSKECLDGMNEWCVDHHAASGLTKKVLHSTTSEREAEKQVIEFVKRHVGTYTPMLAGNSVYVDFIFLKKYMPDLASLFSHVVVDVSSVRALCIRWYPKDNRRAPPKEMKHRALDDIRESIMELKYYKQNIFKSKSKK